MQVHTQAKKHWKNMRQGKPAKAKQAYARCIPTIYKNGGRVVEWQTRWI